MHFRFMTPLILLAFAAGPGSAQSILYTILPGNHWIDGEFLVTGNQQLTGDLQAESSITQTGTGPNFFNGSTSSFNGRICVGTACQSNEPLVSQPLQLKSTQADLVFVDTSTGGAFADHDWGIRINDAFQFGNDKFAIEDITAATIPLTIMGGAPSNALWVAEDGDVGLGTAIPQADLHIVDIATPNIRLQQVQAPAYTWEVEGGTVFSIKSRSFSSTPFSIDANAQNNSLVIEGTGEIGLGTSDPTAALHISRNNNTARLLIQDTGALGAQEMLALRNNGGSYFTLDNTDAGTTWFFTHENSAPNRFIIADAVADGPEMTLTAGGDITIPGSFISGSTTLNVPDYVFEDGYALRPLSEVSAFIEDNKHLPDVPSAAQIATDGLDMTSMQMALLRKVEELTLYTLEQEAELTRLRGIEARLAQLETLLQATREARHPAKPPLQGPV